MFLCKQCGYIKTCLNKYGVTNVDYIKDNKSRRLKIYNKIPINIDYQTNLSIFKKSQKLKFICKQCNRESVLNASTLRHNNNYICRQCTLVNTVMSLYNVTSVMHLHEIFIKGRKFYYYDNTMFDSSWELAYYIWLKDNNIKFKYQPNISFDYIYDNKIHKYFPDFLINNILYEIKGDHFLKNNTMICPYDHSRDAIFDIKFKCMQYNNIKILTKTELNPVLKYIREKYGKDYLKQYIIKK